MKANIRGRILPVIIIGLVVLSGFPFGDIFSDMDPEGVNKTGFEDTYNDDFLNDFQAEELDDFINQFKAGLDDETPLVESGYRAENDTSTDSDDDGLSDSYERALGTNPYLNDSDEDGLSDWEEVYLYETCPYRESTDGDMYDDGMEVLGHSPADLGELGGDMPGYVQWPGTDVFSAAYPEIDIEVSDEINVETVQEITTSHTTIETNTWDYQVTTVDGSSTTRGSEETHTHNEWQQTHNSEYDRQFAEDYRFQLAGPQNFVEGRNLGIGITTQQGTQVTFDIDDTNPRTGNVNPDSLGERELDMLSSVQTPAGGMTSELWEQYLSSFYSQEETTMSQFALDMYNRAKDEGLALQIGIVGASIALTALTAGAAAPLVLPVAAQIAVTGGLGVGSLLGSHIYDLKEATWDDIYGYYKENDFTITHYNLNWKGWLLRGANALSELPLLGGFGTIALEVAELLSPMPLPWEYKLPRDHIVSLETEGTRGELSEELNYEITMGSPGLLTDLIENGNVPILSRSSSDNMNIDESTRTSEHISESTVDRGSSQESSYRTTETYQSWHETTVVETQTHSITEEWGTATTNDTSHSAELDFTFYLKNIGTDIAKEIDDLRFNIFIGNSEVPITYPSLENDAISLSNLLPGAKVQFAANNIILSLEELQAIDEGAPIKISVAYYSFGEDQLYYESALGKCVLFQIDDGVADGDESLDKYLIATWGTETYLDVLSRMVPVGLDENFILSSINNQPIDEWSFWNVKLTEYTETRSFAFAEAEPRTRLHMVYYYDSDKDHYNDRTELEIGTNPYNASSHPAPVIISYIDVFENNNNNVTAKLILGNEGNYPVYGISAQLFSVNGNSTIHDGFVGGEGYVGPGETIIVEDDFFNVTLSGNNSTNEVAELSDLVALLHFNCPHESIFHVISVKPVSVKLTNFLESANFTAHDNEVKCVAFSQNDSLFATGSNDLTIKIWETNISGDQWNHITTLEGHDGLISDVEFSHDDKWLISGGIGGYVKIWDTSNWNCLKTLTSTDKVVTRVSFSVDDAWLAIGREHDVIEIYQTSDWTKIETITNPKVQIRCVAFSPDGKWLVSSDSSSRIHIWHAGNWTFVKNLSSHTSQVHSLAFSSDSKWMASCSNDRAIIIWDCSDWSIYKKIDSAHTAYIWQVSFSHDNTILASCSQDETVKFWSLSDLTNYTLEIHSDDVYDVVFSHDDELIATCSADKKVNIIDMKIFNKKSDFNLSMYLSSTDDYCYDGENVVQYHYNNKNSSYFIGFEKRNVTKIENTSLKYAFQYPNGTIIHQSNITTDLQVGNNTINITFTPSDYMDKSAYGQEIKCVVKLVDSQSFLIAEDVVKMTIHDNRTDLFVYSAGINFSDPTPIHNDTIDITTTIYNLGETNATAFNVSLYDGDPERNGTLIGNVTVLSLAVNCSTNVTVQWKAVKGDHDIYVVVDSSDEIEESIEGDNEAHRLIHVRYRPDLKVEASDVSIEGTSITEGDVVWINATVHNTGDVDASDVEVTIYADSEIISNKLVISEIKSGESVMVSLNWTAKRSITTIKVEIDKNQSITELNETNNEVISAISIRTRADLYPDVIQLSTSKPGEKETIVVSSNIWNSGETDAMNVLVRILVDNTVLKEITLELIPAQENRTVTITWTPGGMIGILRILVDPFDRITESNESNNMISESFDITTSPPIIQLYSPDGGEMLMKEEWCIITWEAAGNLGTGPIDLYYSINGGTSWTVIESGLENTGYYNWTVPNTETETGLIRVTVTDIYNTTVSDVSDRTFAIDPPPDGGGTYNRVISPSSGDEPTAGEDVMITWKLSGEDIVSIYHSFDFGKSWVLIIEDIGNYGLFKWKVPAGLESENVLIKVQGENSEVTSGFFEIKIAEEQEVTDDEDSEEGNDYFNYASGICIATVVVLVLFRKYRNDLNGKPKDEVNTKKRNGNNLK